MAKPRAFIRHFYEFRACEITQGIPFRHIVIYMTASGPDLKLSTARKLRDWLNEVIEWMEACPTGGRHG